MTKPDDDENKAFNQMVHQMLYWDNTPGSTDEPIRKEDVAECLRMIWRHLGGEVTLSWQEKMEQKR